MRHLLLLWQVYQGALYQVAFSVETVNARQPYVRERRRELNKFFMVVHVSHLLNLPTLDVFECATGGPQATGVTGYRGHSNIVHGILTHSIGMSL